MKFPRIYIFILFTFVSSACNSNQNSDALPNVNVDTNTNIQKDTVMVPQVPPLTYTFIKKKDWVNQKDSFVGAKHLDILIAINRVDSAHIKRLDSIVVPNRFDLTLYDYLPFPNEVEALKPIHKILLFSYPAQAFAAYENGKLVREGQTNMGKKSTPTPKKLYFANWKSKKSISTVNKSWILPWNFNVHNTMGIGFHQFDLPGYPASHSCMRLQKSDAFFLYNWTNQWILKGVNEIAKGTPLIVFGDYPWGKTRPWNLLPSNPESLTITQDSIKNIIAPHLNFILQKQSERDAIKAQSL